MTDCSCWFLKKTKHRKKWSIQKMLRNVIILLECLLPYAHHIAYWKCMGSEIQTTVKANELSWVMTLCRHGFHNDVMVYILRTGESTIHRNFFVWVVFMETILSCLLNLKIAAGFKPVLHRVFLGIMVHICIVH